MIQDVPPKDVGDGSFGAFSLNGFITGTREGIVRRDDMNFATRVFETKVKTWQNRYEIFLVVDTRKIYHLDVVDGKGDVNETNMK